jgi:hypothetical protein
VDISKTYLVWSNEHRVWWGIGQWGFVQDLDEAHRYSRDEAVEVCLGTMPARHDQPLNDVPVRLEDIELLLRRFAEAKSTSEDNSP